MVGMVAAHDLWYVGSAAAGVAVVAAAAATEQPSQTVNAEKCGTHELSARRARVQRAYTVAQPQRIIAFRTRRQIRARNARLPE